MTRDNRAGKSRGRWCETYKTFYTGTVMSMGQDTGKKILTIKVYSQIEVFVKQIFDNDYISKLFINTS